MKVMVFCATDDEKVLYEKYSNSRLELSYTKEALTFDNADMYLRGMQAIIILTRCIINEHMASILKKNGIKYVITRSAGYDHIDVKSLNINGIKVANVPRYSPNAISEYVCMMVLMLLRNERRQLKYIENGDFSLREVRGRELKNLCVGVVGTGRIGACTVKLLHGFTSNILSYDLYENEEISHITQYVSLDELYRKSDIIIYHCPLTSKNYHMVDKNAINNMKDGVILINPARGGLWDFEAIEAGISGGKIQSASSDVYENEKEYLRKTNGLSEEWIKESPSNAAFYRLLQNDKFIYSAHTAFYTDTAIENMIETAISNICEYNENNTCSNEISN